MNTVMKLLVGVILLLSLVQSPFTFASSRPGYCPLRNTVTSCSPRCMQDWDCGGDRKCCSNICDSMSCAEPSPVETSEGRNKHSNPGGVKCANVVCQPKQVCRTDTKSRRKFCANY